MFKYLKSLLFICFMFVLPSFTVSQQQSEHITKKASDSVYVNLKFQNPEVVITDKRTITKSDLEKYSLLNKEAVRILEEIKFSVEDFNKFTQEGYIEKSPIEILSVKTGYSIGQINKFILQEKNQKLWLFSVSLLFILVIAFTYNKSYRRLKENIVWMILTIFIIYLLAVVAIYTVWPALNPSWGDYFIFTKLLSS